MSKLSLYLPDGIISSCCSQPSEVLVLPGGEERQSCDISTPWHVPSPIDRRRKKTAKVNVVDSEVCAVGVCG